MATIKVKLNTYRPTKSGRYSLVIQLIHRRERCLLPTGIKIEPEFFDKKRSCIRYVNNGPYKRSAICKLNLHLREELNLVSEKLCRYRTDYTVHEVAEWHKRRKDKTNLFSYLESMIDEKLKLQKYGIANAYRATFNSLKKFCGGEVMSFTDIDFRCLKNYESFLLLQGNTQNTVSYYLRNLRTVYNRAIDDRIFPYPTYGSPFRRIKASSCITVKRALSVEQLKTIASLDLSGNKSLEFYRDMFMASFYLRGIPFVDLVNLSRKNIIGNVICYNRKKTKSRIIIGIIPQLQNLIERYSTTDDYLFPFVSNRIHKNQLSYTEYRNSLHYYNSNLKKLGNMARLNISLTSYVARHSWATCAKNKGVPTSVISECLGHSSETITKVYLKEFDSNILSEANKLVSML